MILYVEEMMYINGISAWAIDFCKMMCATHDIKFMSKVWNENIKASLGNNVEACYYSANKQYETDIFINASRKWEKLKNIKCDKHYYVIHYDCEGCTYPFKQDENYIAVSQYAAEIFTKQYGIPCDYVEGLMMRKPKIFKPLHLISCSRLYKNKGTERMTQLCELLKENNIKYIWDNYCGMDRNERLYRNMNIRQLGIIPEERLLERIMDADYLIQLSESEGYCRAVHQALLVGTPCIVTDIPIFRSVIQDGYNGYRIPLSMQGIDIQKIMQNIPKDFTYDDKYDETKEKWEKILNLKEI